METETGRQSEITIGKNMREANIKRSRAKNPEKQTVTDVEPKTQRSR